MKEHLTQKIGYGFHVRGNGLKGGADIMLIGISKDEGLEAKLKISGIEGFSVIELCEGKSIHLRDGLDIGIEPPGRSGAYIYIDASRKYNIKQLEYKTGQ